MSDAEDSSDEDEAGDIKDYTSSGVNVEDGTHGETTLNLFDSTCADRNIAEIRRLASHQNLASQLAEELRARKRSIVHPQGSESTKVKQEAGAVTNERTYMTAGTLCNPHLQIWDDEEHTLVSSPVIDSIEWSTSGAAPETKQPRLRKAAYENPSYIAPGTYSLQHTHAHTASSTAPTNAVGLGFPLGLFRSAFEEDRLRIRMRDLRARMRALTVRDDGRGL